MLANRSSEHVEQFTHLGTTVTNQNMIQDEFERRIYAGNVCYHSVQNLLSSGLLSKEVKIIIYKIILCSCVWMRNLVSDIREEHKLRLFEEDI
jgi:hypothetical protein